MSEVPAFARSFKRRPLSKRTRFGIFERDDFRCQYCGTKAPDVVLHVDHRKPVSKGGTDDEWNLVTACADCNSGKSDRQQLVWMMGGASAGLADFVFEQLLVHFDLPRLNQAWIWWDLSIHVYAEDADRILSILHTSQNFLEFWRRFHAEFIGPDFGDRFLVTPANDNDWDVV